MTARLWAPIARSVLLAVDGDAPTPMQRTDDGWWHSSVEIDAPYMFVVDGNPIPDPRSCDQPDGLDGPSQALSDFAWTDWGWSGAPLASAVIYEMHVGTFTPEGTFDSAISRLDHLVDLGITAVEVMPIATFPGDRGWGYDGALLFAAQHSYGGPDGFRRFVDACHLRGLAVVLDVVYNHLGPTGNHLHLLGPYFTEAHTTPWGAAVNLDQPGSEEVRQFFVDNAVGWVEHFHVDGLRLDAVHAFHDDSPEPFLRQLAEAVHTAGERLGRTVWVIGESDLNDPTLVDDARDGGDGLDAVWSDDLHHALHVALTGETDGYYADFTGWDDVERALQRVYVFDGRYSMGRGRVHGQLVGDRSRRHFLGYTQSHDQVGNRARGERLGVLAGRQGVEAAAAIVLLSPFVPMLFQGEEWMASTPFLYFTDHRDSEIAAAVTNGRRQEFSTFGSFGTDDVPDPQAPTTFASSRLNWSETSVGDHAAVLDWYRQLLTIRKTHPALVTDGPDDTVAEHLPTLDLFVMRRADAIAVVVNTGDDLVDITGVVPDGVVLMSNDVEDRSGWDASDAAPGRLLLAPRCTVVMERRP